MTGSRYGPATFAVALDMAKVSTNTALVKAHWFQGAKTFTVASKVSGFDGSGEV